MDFSGHLSAFPAAHILQWAANERRTGALVVRRTRCEKRLYFRHGRVVAALSDDPGESYGRYLLLRGHLDESHLVQALQRCRQTGRRLGAVLVELGTVPQEAVQRTLHEHFCDNACDIFLWERGVFYFEAEAPPDEEIPPDSLDTIGLVMEGTRWIDEMARIRRIFVHDHVVLRHGPKYPAGGLEPFESRVGAAVDDRSTLAQIYTTVRGSYFRFLECAYRLCLREVLDLVSTEAERDAPEPATTELRLPDLILERSAERPMAVSITVFSGLYPVLTELPSREELERHPPAVAGFLTELDGHSTLAEMLATDRDLAEQQVDALMVELRQGRAALLPSPVERLEEVAEAKSAPTAARWWRKLVSRG